MWRGFEEVDGSAARGGGGKGWRDTFRISDYEVIQDQHALFSRRDHPVRIPPHLS